MKILVQLIDNSKLDVVVKGDRDTVIKTLAIAMKQTPELAEALLKAAELYCRENRFTASQFFKS